MLQFSKYLRPALVVLACVLPVYLWLTPHSYWVDEVWTASMMQESWSGLVNNWFKDDVHPPLYFILLRLWAFAFGNGEYALRSFSLLGYLGAMAIYYRYARTLSWPAFAISLLMMAAPVNLYYAAEARTYGFMFFITTWLYWPLYFNPRFTRLTYVKITILSLTHLFGTLLAGLTLGIFWLSSRGKPTLPPHQQVRLLPALLTMLPVGLFLAWMLLYGRLLHYGGNAFWFNAGPFKGIRELLYTLLPFGYLPMWGKALTVALLALLACPMAISQHPYGRRLVIVLLAFAGIMFASHLKFKWLIPRYLLAALPLAALLAGQALGQLRTLPWPRLNTLRYPAFLALLALALVFWFKEARLQTKLRLQPVQNLVAQAHYAASLNAPIYHVMPGPKYNAVPPYIVERLHSYYLHRFYPQNPPLKVIQWADVPRLQPPFALLCIHGHTQEYTDSLPPRFAALATKKRFSKKFSSVLVIHVPDTNTPLPISNQPALNPQKN
ncbi:MAG TPA: hypothetical protein PKD90_10170 [Phnomibacter sp.]|nr:hypothetical protein [Phnomibacter sp.]